MTNKELLLLLEKALLKKVSMEGVIDPRDVEGVIAHYMYEIDNEPKPVEKFIFVEDGSVDVDELIESLNMTNPEIKVVVYRQGARSPELVEVKEGTK